MPQDPIQPEQYPHMLKLTGLNLNFKYDYN